MNMVSAFKRNPVITTLILLHFMIRNRFCLNLFIDTRADRLDLVVTNTQRVISSVDRTITVAYIVRYMSSAQEVTDRRKFIKTSVENKRDKRRFFTIIVDKACCPVPVSSFIH